jgi:hypothetical protein
MASKVTFKDELAKLPLPATEIWKEGTWDIIGKGCPDYSREFETSTVMDTELTTCLSFVRAGDGEGHIG